MDWKMRALSYLVTLLAGVVITGFASMLTVSREIGEIRSDISGMRELYQAEQRHHETRFDTIERELAQIKNR